MIKVLTKNKWIGLTFLAALISKNMDIKIPNRYGPTTMKIQVNMLN